MFSLNYENNVSLVTYQILILRYSLYSLHPPLRNFEPCRDSMSFNCFCFLSCCLPGLYPSEPTSNLSIFFLQSDWANSIYWSFINEFKMTFYIHWFLVDFFYILRACFISTCSLVHYFALSLFIEIIPLALWGFSAYTFEVMIFFCLFLTAWGDSICLLLITLASRSFIFLRTSFPHKWFWVGMAIMSGRFAGWVGPGLSTGHTWICHGLKRQSKKSVWNSHPRWENPLQPDFKQEA